MVSKSDVCAALHASMSLLTEGPPVDGLGHPVEQSVGKESNGMSYTTYYRCCECGEVFARWKPCGDHLRGVHGYNTVQGCAASCRVKEGKTKDSKATIQQQGTGWLMGKPRHGSSSSSLPSSALPCQQGSGWQGAPQHIEAVKKRSREVCDDQPVWEDAVRRNIASWNQSKQIRND